MSQFFWPPQGSADGIVRYNLNGSVTQVSQDTITPANSKPLPVVNLDSSGVPVDYATAAKQDAQTTLLTSINSKDFATSAKQDSQITSLGEISTNTLVISTAKKTSGAATDTSMLQVGGSDGTNARTLAVDNTGRAKVVVDAYTNGQVDNGTLTTTAATLVSAPANAVGFIVQNESSNANSIRFRVGGTASTTAGVLLEPGRDSGLVPIGANVSLCNTVSSSQAYSVLWVIK